MYLKVAIPRPLDRLFDYEYPVDQFGDISVGDWVQVPFGRSKLVGCVVELSQDAPTLPEDVVLKSVISKIPSEYSLPVELVQLCRFGAEYYQYPIGEAFFSAQPPSPEKELSTRKIKLEEMSAKNILLNEEQKLVADTIEQKIKESINPVFLLEGITGSGKSEVYIEIAKKRLG